MRTLRMGQAFALAASGASAEAVTGDFPMNFPEEESKRRRIASLSTAFLVHGGAIALLLFVASLAPVIEETIIPVSLIHDEADVPEPTPEPAPARRALAERRSLNYAPAMQAVQPQIVNPHVIANASPAINAEALDMDALSNVAAPTQIARTSSVVVARVSAVRSIVGARASRVDIGAIGGPVVRGPVPANASGTTSGTGKLTIGGGSSVREGVLSTRDVQGSPTGARLVRVDTAVGDGYAIGPGGDGSGTTTGRESRSATASSCFGLPSVQNYLGNVQDRTLERWALPPGVDANQLVTLKFRIDVAGSASKVSLVKADDNALGVSAIDALRTASPFPPIPDAARCLARVPITATFSNPSAS
jgi:TonB family protein